MDNVPFFGEGRVTDIGAPKGMHGMPELNLDEMSLAELKKLRRDVQRAITGFVEKQKRAARAAAEAAVREMGFSLADVIVATGSNRSKSSLRPRYRHPEDATRTWNGRGRKPEWIREALASGQPIEELRLRD